METKLKEAVQRVRAFLDARRWLDPNEKHGIASHYDTEAKSHPLISGDLRALVDAVDSMPPILWMHDPERPSLAKFATAEEYFAAMSQGEAEAARATDAQWRDELRAAVTPAQATPEGGHSYQIGTIEIHSTHEIAPETLDAASAIMAAKQKLQEWAMDDRNDDPAEGAFWRFDARRKGYNRWKGAPQSERDAFKAEYRAALAASQQTQDVPYLPVGPTLTPNEQQAVECGRCPKCKGAVRHIHDGAGMRFHQCANCMSVFVTTAP
jgi:hypothetical protein